MKKYIGLVALLTIAIFLTRMKNMVDDERFYMAKISGDNDVSTIVLVRGNRALNLEEATDNFTKNFIVSCGSCDVDEQGYMDELPEEYQGVF